MKIRFFTIDILDASRQQSELNAFLASHKVLAISRELVRLEDRAYWSFCIEYAESTSAPVTDSPDKKPKVDYKELLPDDQFEQFSRLRVVRKEIAEREDVPVYNVLTNAQMAEIVQNRVNTREGLIAVKGVGESRVKRFGDDLLACLQSLFKDNQP
jgi:superfamily II DNA helicase RecQ